MSKLAVAIPTYNRQQYLKDCLRSVLNQTFQDFSIYIFDNASDYDIEKFLSEEFNDKRIILLKSDHHIGYQYFSRILEYPFSEEYLIVFHDDDTMHPLLLEKEIEILEKDKNLVFVGTGMKFIKNHQKIFHFSKIKEKIDFEIFENPADLIRLILKDFDFCYDSVMYRRKFIGDTRPKDDIFFKWGDRPFLIELAKKGKVGVIKEKLVNYRIHFSQDTRMPESFSYLFNLFLYYKNNLPYPLRKRDIELFYNFSTNNLILSGFSFSKNWQEYKKFLRAAKESGVFDLRYLNFRGIYYFLKGFKSYIFKKNE